MRKESRHGFTLIELLVVIAIIAILATILFPVFISTREKARTVRCIANLKNIGLALEMYREDYNRKSPDIWQAPGGSEVRSHWTFVLIPYITQTIFRDADRGTSRAGKNDYDNVYVCPSAPWLRSEMHGGLSTGLNTKPVAQAYAMNETGWRPNRAPYGDWAGMGLKDKQVKNPGELIFVSEGLGYGFGVAFGNDYNVDNSQGMVGGGAGWWSNHPRPQDDPIPLYTPGVYNPRNGGSKSKIYHIRVSHNNGANCLFYDGHVKFMKVTMHYNWSVINWQ